MPGAQTLHQTCILTDQFGWLTWAWCLGPTPCRRPGRVSAVRPVPLEIPRPPYVDSRGREGLVAWQWQWLVDVGWLVGGLGWVGLGWLVGWLVG